MSDYSSTGYQANVNKSAGNYVSGANGRQIQSRDNGDILDPGTGIWMPRTSIGGSKALGTAATAGNPAEKWAAAQNQAEAAQVDQQEVEDRMTENKSRNDSMNSVAVANAQRGTQLGRGLYQRRQAGSKLGGYFNQLSAGNASAMKAARMKTLQAKQAADITRTNPVLGYRAALAGLQKQLA